MRNAFCDALVEHGTATSLVFLTGDLGFMALEPLQAALGDRFVNAGVAEQNMIGVAAGIASTGRQCWAYSIAPFIYARPFEQIRNDVCLHDFDVKLVGNGGGYGYGVMGATHHAIEDYGVMCGLQNMRVFVPAFAKDVAPVVARMAADPHPGYLRLGRCEKPADLVLPDYAPWRCLLRGDAGVLVIVGPGAGGFLAMAATLPPESRPDIWVATELPLRSDMLPAAVLAADRLYVVEEHVAQGGVGQMLAHLLLLAGAAPRRFRHFHADGYRSGRYGSQAFHRVENGIDAAGVLAEIATCA
ncbi:MAG: transketolase [Alphaproteobacteria bacterium]|nr:MAG: transketolase [Alphaproteobacteria bacterium]